MILGLSVSAFTAIHVAISLVGILSGVVVLAGLLRSAWLPSWNWAFLTSTIATSVTGFMFPFASFGPPEVIGLISLLTLAGAVVATLRIQDSSRWYKFYVVSAALALYLNVFVAVVQSFQKIPALRAISPSQSGAPFIVTQSIVMIGFIAAGYFAAADRHRAAVQRLESF